MKRLVASVLGAALVAATASAALADGKPEKTDIKIAFASTGITYLPAIMAKALGYYDEAGLNVTVAAFSGGSKALQAMMGGSADIVSGAYSHTIELQAKGQDLVTFAVQVNCPGWIFGIGKKDFDSVKSVVDLKGKRVGVSSPGSSTNQAVNYMLAKAGLSQKDVAIIGVGQDAGAVAAVKAGEIDALIINDPGATILMQSGDFKPLANFQTRKGTHEVFGGDYPEASLYTKRDFLKENPNTAQALATAVVKAEHWMAKATPAEIAAKVPEKYRGKDMKQYEQALKNSRECISTDGIMDAKGPKVVEEVLATALPDIKNADIDLSKTYTNKYTEKANKGLAK
jgi:NitT/TauT family transport system substrate-binding protein